MNSIDGKKYTFGGSRFAVAVVAAGALMLSACGDDAEATDDAVAEVTEAAEDAGVDTDEVIEDAAEAAEDLVEDAAEEAADGVDTEEVDEQSTALADALRDNGLTTLASAVEQLNVDELIGGEEFTLLGPDDEAFLGLTADDTADILADPEQLLELLRNHVIDERIDSASMAEQGSVTTLGGETLAVVVDGDTVTIGRATVVTADIEAGDGVVHVIDQVLLP